MPRFLSMTVESFARFVHPLTLDLHRRGLVLVEGENRDSGDAFDSNGAGKSMLFEALTWALFGKMARYGDERLGAEEVCYGEHGADVSVVFENAHGRFTVQRVRDRRGSPQVDLRVEENGEWVPMANRGVNAALATDDLASLLGFDYRTLRNAIFLQGTGMDVSGSTFAKQMRLLESVLRFDDFTRGAKVAAERGKTLELEARDHLHAMEQWSRQSETAQHTIKELETLDETVRETELVERIRAARESRDRIGEIDVDSATHTWRDALDDRTQKQSTLDNRRLHLGAVQAIDGGRCYLCDSKVTTKQRDALIEIVVSDLTEREIAVTQAEARLSRCQKILEHAKTAVEVRDGLQRQIHQDERELRDIRDRTSRRLGIIQTQTDRLTEAEHHLADLTEQVAATRRNILLAQTWSKHGFEDLKTEILGAAAPVLNEAADRYANILSDGSLRVEFTTIRESRGENLLRIRRAGDVCAYESLSNGERRRVDLIVALALRSCARWRIAEPINLSVWDEVFDKLDESGMRRAIEVLQQDLSELETVFVITHSAALKTMFDGARVLRVIRQHGVSHLA